MGRVRRTVDKINQRLTVKLAATILAGSTLLSSLLGFFRDRLLNSAYMPSKEAGLAGYPVGLDAYTAAFMVPDFSRAPRHHRVRRARVPGRGKRGRGSMVRPVEAGGLTWDRVRGSSRGG